MKIYRVIPGSFVTNKRLDSQELFGVEDIFYKMGYCSFLGKRGFHCFNNICNNIDEEGKYFYIFAEDAILEGLNLIAGFHRLNTDMFYVVEYDVPDEIVFKHIGYGDYTEGIFHNHLIETFIRKSDIEGEILSSSEIDDKRLLDVLINCFNSTLDDISTYGSSAFEDYAYYYELFDMTNLKDIVDDYDKIREILISYSFECLVKSLNGDIIKTPFITGNIIPVNPHYILHQFHNFEKATSYFKDMGINVDFSSEHSEYKKEILRYLYGNVESVNKEQAKKLIMDKKIFNNDKD